MPWLVFILVTSYIQICLFYLSFPVLLSHSCTFIPNMYLGFLSFICNHVPNLYCSHLCLITCPSLPHVFIVFVFLCLPASLFWQLYLLLWLFTQWVPWPCFFLLSFLFVALRYCLTCLNPNLFCFTCPYWKTCPWPVDSSSIDNKLDVKTAMKYILKSYMTKIRFWCLSHINQLNKDKEKCRCDFWDKGFILHFNLLFYTNTTKADMSCAK